MSVRVDNGTIHLSGRCLAEDAESLMVALQDDPGRIVDLEMVQRLHLAVVQILLAVRPTLHGLPDNLFLGRLIVNLLQ